MISAPACSTFGVQQVQVGAVRGLLQLGIRVLGEAVAHRFDSLGEVGVLEDEAVELSGSGACAGNKVDKSLLGWNRGKYAKASRSRAAHKRANGRLPNRSIICRNKECKAYAAAVTPRREPLQAASGIESHAVDACGRPFPARWPCQSDISQMSIDIRSDIITSASRCPAAGCRRSRTGRSWPDPSSHRGTKPGWRPGWCHTA